MKDRTNNNNNNGVNLLKILSMFLIILFHTTQTIGNNGFGLSNIGDIPIHYSYFAIDLRFSSADIQTIILNLFGNLGSIGNDIFFVCSAWYLCDKSYRFKKSKVIQIALDSTVISLIIFVISLFALPTIETKFIIRSLFPNLLNIYWYVTCYIMFYLIAPYINRIIYSLDKREHISIALTLFFIYFIICFVDRNLFYCNDIIIWISLYFLVSYIKKYFSCRYLGVIKHISCITFFCIIFEDLLINILGQKIVFFYDKVHYFQCNNNPFIIVFSLCMFLLFININFNFKINRNIAGLTLYVYLIHGNILVRNYYMPILLSVIKQNLGYELIILIDIVVSVILFISSFFCASIYKQTIGKFIPSIIEGTMQKIKIMLIRRSLNGEQ